jgi:hypothetical protein
MKTLSISLLTLLTSVSAIASSLPGEDLSARRARCELTIDGVNYMAGACNFNMLPRFAGEPGGSFEIRRRGYVVRVITNGDGTARGYFNGMRGEESTRVRLGTLVRNGACWVNERAIVCARS